MGTPPRAEQRDNQSAWDNVRPFPDRDARHPASREHPACGGAFISRPDRGADSQAGLSSSLLLATEGKRRGYGTHSPDRWHGPCLDSHYVRQRSRVAIILVVAWYVGDHLVMALLD
jgi:hypothetical protein